MTQLLSIDQCIRFNSTVQARHLFPIVNLLVHSPRIAVMDSGQVTELLECPVCFKQLDETCKFLPCQHTFCRQCLREIVQGSKELRCPECRILVEKDIDDLPANIFLVRFLESLKLGQHRKESLDSTGKETGVVSVKDKQKLYAPRTQKQAEETIQHSGMHGISGYNTSVHPSGMHGIAWYNASVLPSGMQGIPGAGKVPCAWGICSLPLGGVHEQHPELGRPEGPNQGLQAIWKSPQARGPGRMPAQRPARKFGRYDKKQRWELSLAASVQSQEPVKQVIYIPGQEPLTTSMLASISPQEQKRIIGERLYPLIQSTHPDQAGKITGMLLEIDNAGLLHMLESREALAAKTQEAVSVLRAHSAQERGEIKNEKGKTGRNARKQPRGRPLAVSMQPQPEQQAIYIPGQEPLNSRELAAASPQEQKQIIGERLYPLIQSTHPDQAGKITGMLVELDNAELLHMLESREALAAKTQEAVSVLRMHRQEEIEAQRLTSNMLQLAAASPQDQKQIIGEHLYPLIEATHPEKAAKITGMLLELDIPELMNMLESREALAAKTQEAVLVLRAYNAREEAQRKNGSPL
ncbi:uncharacterized protein [Acropora muricata]|uniref:uncharacterized protein isoform X2 n=1 Tax=Acropora muricata TaxID=159855 RepID=UPI0034E53F78